MSGFSIEWLNLREDADLQARDPDLLARAMNWLESGSAAMPIVLDLGAGTGSSLRALTASNKPVMNSVCWRLVDNDSALLAEASRRHGSSEHLEIHAMDLGKISTLPMEGTRLITASALFDLVSADFLEALTAAASRASENVEIAIYAALNYDGRTDWNPVHPLDGTILTAFNTDQRRDKGFGPALGPDAVGHMTEIFSRAGFQVRAADSPWNLGPADKKLTSTLIEGIAGAVTNQGSIDLADVADWKRFRQLHVATGNCTVGHTDVLALSRQR